MSRKYVKLKDPAGNYLFPNAYKDDLGNVIKNTYVSKSGKDHYIYKAYIVEGGTSEVPEGVNKLVLIDRGDPDHLIEFYAIDPDYVDSVLYNANLYNRLEELEKRVKELENDK